MRLTDERYLSLIRGNEHIIAVFQSNPVAVDVIRCDFRGKYSEIGYIRSIGAERTREKRQWKRCFSSFGPNEIAFEFYNQAKRKKSQQRLVDPKTGRNHTREK